MKTLLLAFLIAFPVLAADTYYCPMKCEGAKTYQKPGTCPVCGMNLEKKGDGESAHALNTRDFRVDMTAEPKLAKAGKPVTLTFFVRRTKDNSTVKDFQVVHDKKVHLIAISQDLGWFAHEHPTLDAEGKFRQTLTLPRGGNFVLYFDVTPKGERNQVFPLALQVDGPKSISSPLVDTTKEVRRVFNSYTVTMKIESLPLKAGTPVTLKYKIKLNGKDLLDLEPYLGALGHNVIVSEDTTDYLHAHPPGEHHEGHAHEGNVASNGPEVSFMTTFPRSGLYKSWAQFKHQNRILTADFVIKVP